MAEDPTVDDLAAQLQASIALLARRIRQTPAPGGLSLPERSALARLDRGGPATASELARAEQITPQAMATTLGALEERGLVRRRADPQDRRQVIMSLTDAGLELLRHKRDARARRLAKTLAESFTPAELRTLMAAAALIERLGESI